MKIKKAAGADGIAREAWIYSKGEIREKLKEVIGRVWKRKGFPEEWRYGVITPIYKKGDKNKVENYRGITLLCTAYKVYTSILIEKRGGRKEHVT